MAARDLHSRWLSRHDPKLALESSAILPIRAAMVLRLRRWVLSRPPWRTAFLGGGVLAALAAAALSPFGLDAALVAVVVASVVAGPLLLSVARLHHALEKARVEAHVLAELDPLTGLINHNRFATVLTRDIGVVRRAGGEYSLLLIDIDDLQRVADQHGASAGELVLLGVTNLCSGALRSTDILARWSPGELVIALPGSDRTGAGEVAERLRAGVASMLMTGPKRAPIRATLSIGVATWGAGMESVDALLGSADRAVEAARQAGRNRVVVAASEATA